MGIIMFVIVGSFCATFDYFYKFHFMFQPSRYIVHSFVFTGYIKINYWFLELPLKVKGLSSLFKPTQITSVQVRIL